ncbi:MAG: ANTAR domain-containing protein [Oscillospiraceae bacterium]|nr:ANTAR domain-containing protein [Oscillospiraceae bacterium]
MLRQSVPSNVLVVSRTPNVSELLRELFPPERLGSVTTLLTCAQAKRALLSAQYDIIVINAPLADEFGSRFALDAVADTSCVVLFISPSEQYEEQSAMLESYGVLTLEKPITKSAFYAALRLSLAMRERLRAMERKNQSLNDKMGELRLINRAKWALIEGLSMTEKQAHRYIEKQAMDMRLSKLQVAESIIRTYEK